MSDEKKYHCPRCKSENLILYSEIIECPNCNLSFTKQILDKLEDEDVMADEELRQIIRHIYDQNDVE